MSFVLTPRAAYKESIIRNIIASREHMQRESLRERTENRSFVVKLHGETFYVNLAVIAKASQKFYGLIIRNQLDNVNPEVFEAIVMVFEGENSYLEGTILPQVLEFAITNEERLLLTMLWRFLASERRTSVTVQALCQTFSLVRNGEFKGDVSLGKDYRLQILANIMIALLEHKDIDQFNRVVLLGSEEVSPFLGTSVARISDLEHKHVVTACYIRCECTISGRNNGRSYCTTLSAELTCKNCKTTLCSYCCRLNGELRTCPGQIVTKIFNDIDPLAPPRSSDVVETSYSQFGFNPENEFPPSSPSDCNSSSSSHSEESEALPVPTTIPSVTITTTTYVRKPKVPQRPCIFVDDSTDEESEVLSASHYSRPTFRKPKVPQRPCIFVDDSSDSEDSEDLSVSNTTPTTTSSTTSTYSAPTTVRKPRVPQRPCIFVDDSTDEDSEALPGSRKTPETAKKYMVPQRPSIFVDNDNDE